MIDAISGPLGYDFFVRALVASALTGLVCAVVGSYVVLKGLAFIGDAVAHAAFPGIVAALLLKGSFYLGAGIAAVATALTIGWVSRHSRLRIDTAIGVVFAGTFALGIFLWSSIRHFVVDPLSFFFGNVLAIGPDDLVGLLILGGLILALVVVFWKELLYATFDPLGAAASGLPVARLEYLVLALVALTIVVSVQAVGIILVVAMLVTPAATAQLVSVRYTRLMGTAIAVGVGSAIGGLYASYWLDVASGATIVLIQTGLFLVALLVGRSGPLRARRPLPEPAAAPAASGRTSRP